MEDALETIKKYISDRPDLIKNKDVWIQGWGEFDAQDADSFLIPETKGGIRQNGQEKSFQQL